MDLHMEWVSPRLHFVMTEHVNWVIYSGPDGVTLIDAGYVGQRDLLELSLLRMGRSPRDVDSVLLTHAHADHLGGASWLAAEYGTPVYSGDREVAHAKRERLEQVGVPDVLRNALRPGVLSWAAGIFPLLDGKPKLGVPGVRPLPLDGGRVDVPGSPVPATIAGHTTGSTVYLFPDEGVVVVGDALVTGHRTSLREGPQMLLPMFHHDEKLALASLEQLAEMDAGIILPGHGPSWKGSPREAVALAVGPERAP